MSSILKKIIPLSIICLLLIGCTRESTANNSLFNQVVNPNVNTSYFNEIDLETVIKKSYYKNQIPEQFNSYGIMNPKPDIYVFYWNNKLISLASETLNYNYDQNKVNEYLKLLLDEQHDHNSYLPTMLTNLYFEELKYLSDMDSYENTKIEFWESHFDEESNLFYLDAQEDSIEGKLSITLELLRNESFRNYISNDILSKIKEKAKDLVFEYYQDSKDSIIDIHEALNGRGIALYILKLLDYNLSEEEKKILSHWIDQINLQSKELLLNKNSSTFIYLNLILDLNEYIGYKNVFPKDILDSSILTYSQTDDSYYFIVEPVTYTNMLEVYSKLNYDFPYKNPLFNYLDDTIASGFNQFNYVQTDIEENYYGLFISEAHNIEYNKESQIDNITFQYQYFIENSSEVNSLDELMMLNYLLKTYYLLELEVNNPELIISKVTSYIEKLDDKDEREQIKSYYYYMELLTLIKGSFVLSKSTHDKIVKLISEVSNDIYESIDVYYLGMILGSLKGNDTLKEETFKKIIQTINDLYTEEGFKSSTASNSTDFINTYMALVLISNISENYDLYIQSANKYLESELINDEYYGIIRNSKRLELKALHYAILLSSLVVNYEGR